ncbi:MAG TPA: hypothetical protein VFD29_12460 [Gillisia sp.]|nr:hypothetical protein [Gillisia sp.]
MERKILHCVQNDMARVILFVILNELFGEEESLRRLRGDEIYDWA